MVNYKNNCGRGFEFKTQKSMGFRIDTVSGLQYMKSMGFRIDTVSGLQYMIKALKQKGIDINHTENNDNIANKT